MFTVSDARERLRLMATVVQHEKEIDQGLAKAIDELAAGDGHNSPRPLYCHTVLIRSVHDRALMSTIMDRYRAHGWTMGSAEGTPEKDNAVISFTLPSEPERGGPDDR